MELGNSAQVEIIGVKAIGRLADRTLSLELAELGLDCAGDAARHLVLQFEDVVESAVEAVGPDVGAGGGVDQLAGDAHSVLGFAHRALEHIAHAQLARTCFTSTARPLYVKLELRAITNSHGRREIAVVISSTMPSTK